MIKENESMAVVLYIMAADCVGLAFLAWLWMR
jgi:hypothetical protein